MNEIWNQMPNEIIMFGGTGAALEARPIIEDNGGRVVAVFDHTPNLKPPFRDVPLYEGGYDRFLSWLSDWRGMERPNPGFCIAIGNPHGRVRLALHEKLVGEGLTPVTISHPSAVIADDAIIEQGTQILAGAIIDPSVTIGRQCIVNLGATVAHGTVLEGGVEVGPGAIVCGDVRIDTGAWICAGAIVLPRVKIGADAKIGAGAVVTRNMPSGVTAFGVPARIISRGE